MQLIKEPFILRKLSSSYHPLVKSGDFDTNIRSKEYIPLINQLTYYDGNVPENVIMELNKFHNDTTTIFQSLIPLFELGLSFDLSICGGAARDLVLGKPIKDLDLLISIESEKCEKLINQLTISDFSKIYQTTDFNFLNSWNNHNLSVEQKFYDLVLYSLKRNLSIHKEFSPSVDITTETFESYKDSTTVNRLNGVIKLEDNQLHYPCDILITNLSTYAYVNAFDFEICKAYLYLVDHQSPYLRPNTIFDYLNTFICTHSFLDDILSKQLTFNMASRNKLSSIINSMDNHYPRIQSKFNDYTLNLIPGNEQEYIIWKNHYDLNQKLPAKIENTKRNKI